MAILALGALATGLGAALATGNDERGGRLATAVLHDADGNRVGVAVFKDRHGTVAVSAKVWGLAPEFHGFHVHAVGECVPPFTSAGGHLDLSANGVPHGEHAGDLPSLLVNGDGTGRLQFETDRFSVSDLFDEDGSALMVHAGRDNYANIPDRYTSEQSPGTPGPDADTLATGDAGERAACGVVEMDRRDDD